MGAGLTGVAVFVAALLTSLPHWVWLTTLVIGLFVCTYFTWRDEYAKTIRRRMIGRIDGIITHPIDGDTRFLVSVKIRNLAKRTAIHEWSGRHINSDGANTHFTGSFLERGELRTERGRLGDNLADDQRTIARGEIRSGWLAIRIPQAKAYRIFEKPNKNLTFSFSDTFGDRFKVTMFDDPTLQ